jgi:hypothetical protein
VSERRLVSIRRTVATGHAAAYDVAWSRLHRAATALGAHAWRFRSLIDAELRLEFLECKDAVDPRDQPAVADALAALDQLAHAHSVEEWIGG